MSYKKQGEFIMFAVYNFRMICDLNLLKYYRLFEEETEVILLV